MSKIEDTRVWQELHNTPATTDVGAFVQAPQFTTLFIEKGGESEGKKRTIEATQIVCSKKRGFAGKHIFDLPQYVIRRGCFIIYADENSYAEAIRIAKGEVAYDWQHYYRKQYKKQVVRWYNLQGSYIDADLEFLNLTRKRNVPPAKWWLYVPRSFRLKRDSLPENATKLGYIKLMKEQYFPNGKAYPVFGRIEFYGGCNVYVISHTTLLRDQVSDWLESSGWYICGNCAVRFYGTKIDRVFIDGDVSRGSLIAASSLTTIVDPGLVSRPA